MHSRETWEIPPGLFICGGNNGCAVVSGYRLAVRVAVEAQFSKEYRLGRLCGRLA